MSDEAPGDCTLRLSGAGSVFQSDLLSLLWEIPLSIIFQSMADAS